MMIGMQNSWKVCAIQLVVKPIERLNVLECLEVIKFFGWEINLEFFLVKSSYLTTKKNSFNSAVDPTWKKIWKIHLHERIKLFLWRLPALCLL